jgi:hypothetical protein
MHVLCLGCCANGLGWDSLGAPWDEIGATSDGKMGTASPSFCSLISASMRSPSGRSQAALGCARCTHSTAGHSPDSKSCRVIMQPRAHACMQCCPCQRSSYVTSITIRTSEGARRMLRGFVCVSDRLLGELGLANLTVGWQLTRSTWSDSIRRGPVVHRALRTFIFAQIHDREWGFTCCDLHLNSSESATDRLCASIVHACPILRGQIHLSSAFIAQKSSDRKKSFLIDD